MKISAYRIKFYIAQYGVFNKTTKEKFFGNIAQVVTDITDKFT